jgi:hypothetical protein
MRGIDAYFILKYEGICPSTCYLASKTTQMKKIILTYGIIAGIMVSALMLLGIFINKDHDLTVGMIYGYATMIMAFSMIYVAIRQFRNQFMNGKISFGKALLIGLGITLIASIFYVLTWEIEFKYVFPDFMQGYAKASLESMKTSGASAASIQQATSEMDEMVKSYNDPLYRIPLTFAEILPVGVLISLICAFILKRK